ncbi:MAG TPA: glutamine--fructose-6-phosphate transaminase (isomerizing), partial [Thermoplasmata archaeon]|nr:glutamine--fructose-6-phosphate transaminase (isomerizing) [Thermoplasmata archaeon]
TGIAHTRWATHGKPTTENAHPFLDCKCEYAVVHNGILTNYMGLKEELLKKGHKFASETDSEVFAHLIEDAPGNDLKSKVLSVLRLVDGAYAIAVIEKGKNEIIAARNESPLVVGVGHDENFVASDVTALLKYTNEVIYLMDKEAVRITPDSIETFDLEGRTVERESQRVSWNLEDAERSGYPHFMLKEIFEQPRAIHESLLGRLESREEDSFFKSRFPSIKIIGCGTSYHAGLVGKYILEGLSRIPTTTQISSEYRYSSVTESKPLVVCITQSGETADTLGAAKEARRRGCKTLAITNVLGSAITREADHVIYTRAGPEIGVAATKTFVTQLIALYLLGLELGTMSNTLSSERRRELVADMRSLPRVVQSVLNEASKIESLAENYKGAHSMFFIGRHINYPTSLEGALKTKEISYIHGEGYPAGELKHGPLALLSKDTPVIAICVRDHTYEKMLGNVREVSARGSPVLAIGSEGDQDLVKYAEEVFLVPRVDPLFSPIPIIVALQLLAYYLAMKKGCPIDKPRNIAKTVTVE